MNIGIDIDGVLTDLSSFYLDYGSIIIIKELILKIQMNIILKIYLKLVKKKMMTFGLDL